MNVYGEKRMFKQPRPAHACWQMLITDLQDGMSAGVFEPSDEGISHPLIRVKTAMKGDIVIPSINIDSSVLFGSTSANLAVAANAECR